METGRAVVLKEFGKPLLIEEYPVPDPEPGAAIIRITQAGLCGSDLHAVHGSALVPLPEAGRVMGHEGFGVVHRLGPGVTTDTLGQPIVEGDRVVHSAVQSCGHCHCCQRGDPNMCINYPPPRVAGTFPYFYGTYGDYYYVEPGQAFYKVPEVIPGSMLTFVNCAMSTVLEALTKAEAGPGKSMVLFGSGGLGLNATAVARHLGVDHITVFDRQAGRLQLAAAFGADETVNIDEVSTPAARKELVWEVTRGRGADIVVDLVGHPSIIQEGLPMLGNGGTFLQIGVIDATAEATINPGLFFHGKRVIGSTMYRPHRIPALLDFLARNHESLPFDRIGSTTYKLEDVNKAFFDADWEKRGGSTDIIRAVIVP